MAENVPGDGKSSPFGDGSGAVSGVGATSKGNDFTKNPTGNGPKSKGMNFAGQENNLPQKGKWGGFNADSVPSGGRIPDVQPGKGGAAAGGGRKPFKAMSVPGVGNPGGGAPAKISTPAGPDSGAPAGDIPDGGAEE